MKWYRKLKRKVKTYLWKREVKKDPSILDVHLWPTDGPHIYSSNCLCKPTTAKRDGYPDKKGRMLWEHNEWPRGKK